MHRLTDAMHMAALRPAVCIDTPFGLFMVLLLLFNFYTSILIQIILKGSLQPKLKGASVWPFNACSKVATD